MYIPIQCLLFVFFIVVLNVAVTGCKSVANLEMVLKQSKYTYSEYNWACQKYVIISTYYQ